MNENEQVAVAKESKTPNVRVAMALGIPIEWKDRGMVADGTQMWPYVAGTTNLIPDYVGDIAAAETLIPLFGRSVVMEYHAGGIPEPYWSVEYDPGESMKCAATLSAAIVDAFLAAKGGE